MGFEKYVPKTRKKVIKPMVTVSKTGRLGFSQAALEAANLADAEAVALYFNPRSKVMGIKRAESGEEGAFSINHGKRITSVDASDFFEDYNFQLGDRYKIEAKYDQNSEMLLVPLREIPRVRGRRAKAQEAGE